MGEIVSANGGDEAVSASKSSSGCEEMKASGKHVAEVRVKYRDLDEHVGSRLMARVASIVRMGADVAELIDPAKEYVLRIPSWFLGDSDEMWLNRRHEDRDAILPAIMHRNDEGKNVILKNLDAYERPARDVVADAGRDIADALGDAALRRELGECVQRLELISKRVELVIEGQMDDRIALIEGPLRQVRAALASKDSEHVARRLEQAVPILNIGVAQIEAAVKRILPQFSEIPTGAFAIRAKLIMDPDLVVRMNDAFDKIQDCVEYLGRAYTLLAAAEVADGQDESAIAVLEPLRAFLAVISEGTAAFTRLHPEIDFSHEWFSEPKRFMAALEDAVSGLTSDGADDYLIELDGFKLLEAVEDD